MDGVTIVSHPLIQHKLTLLRKKDISTKSFRELLKEIGMLLCYEVTRDLPLELIEPYLDEVKSGTVIVVHLGQPLQGTPQEHERVV